MTGPWPDELVAVAEVICPQGRSGQVKAVPLTGRPERFAGLSAVTAWKDGKTQRLTLSERRLWRGFVILGFAEIRDLDAAESLRGAMICVDAAERAVLPPGEYYHDDLIGLQVVTNQGRRLGRVSWIMATGANDVLVVADEKGAEVCVPALRSVITEIDLGKRIMIIDPPPGLLE